MMVVAPNLKAIADHDGAVILDVRNDTLISMNSVGAHVWAGLEKGKRLEEIVADLAQTTGEDSTVIAKDVDDFVDHLHANNLLVSMHEGKRP